MYARNAYAAQYIFEYLLSYAIGKIYLQLCPQEYCMNSDSHRVDSERLSDVHSCAHFQQMMTRFLENCLVMPIIEDVYIYICIYFDDSILNLLCTNKQIQISLKEIKMFYIVAQIQDKCVGRLACCLSCHPVTDESHDTRLMRNCSSLCLRRYIHSSEHMQVDNTKYKGAKNVH